LGRHHKKQGVIPKTVNSTPERKGLAVNSKEVHKPPTREGEGSRRRKIVDSARGETVEKTLEKSETRMAGSDALKMRTALEKKGEEVSATLRVQNHFKTTVGCASCKLDKESKFIGSHEARQVRISREGETAAYEDPPPQILGQKKGGVDKNKELADFKLRFKRLTFTNRPQGMSKLNRFEGVRLGCHRDENPGKSSAGYGPDQSAAKKDSKLRDAGKKKIEIHPRLRRYPAGRAGGAATPDLSARKQCMTRMMCLRESPGKT